MNTLISVALEALDYAFNDPSPLRRFAARMFIINALAVALLACLFFGVLLGKIMLWVAR